MLHMPTEGIQKKWDQVSERTLKYWKTNIDVPSWEAGAQESCISNSAKSHPCTGYLGLPLLKDVVTPLRPQSSKKQREACVSISLLCVFLHHPRHTKKEIAILQCCKANHWKQKPKCPKCKTGGTGKEGGKSLLLEMSTKDQTKLQIFISPLNHCAPPIYTQMAFKSLPLLWTHLRPTNSPRHPTWLVSPKCEVYAAVQDISVGPRHILEKHSVTTWDTPFPSFYKLSYLWHATLSLRYTTNWLDAFILQYDCHYSLTPLPSHILTVSASVGNNEN